MDDLSNRTIKGYEFMECIGAGGFGAVYRAYQPSVGREVAIKVILPQHANQPDFIRRFEVEAQLIARLENPHIVPLYDYWREPNGAFLVMRWLRGSLRSAVQRGPWSVEATARMLDQIAGALTVAHREDVIHRDIKPDNILLDEDDNAYLADFGIAKNLNVGVGVTEANITQEGAVVGSPAYITPEQINGEVVTPRSDIYSLGIVLYEILVGEKPYTDAQTPYELIVHQLKTPLPALHVRRPNLPAALNEVLQTATAKDPAQRYANALRFAAAFRAALPNLQRAPAQPLAEPLTERELDIIRLMIEGLSNAEIAARFVVSSATVKWYVQQIYAKLDVHSRRQAVDRAKQLNLNAHTPLPATINVDMPTYKSAGAKSKIAASPELVNPYKGLRAFQEADAADFFGRAALTEQLLARLAESGEGARFLGIVGPSGSGKSSIVRAGLIPALRRGGLLNSNRWFITDMMPGTHPLEELEAALLRVASSPQSGLLSQLSEDRRGLVRAAKRILPADQDTELVLVIDQFEELFTLVDEETVRGHFIDNLLSAATDPRSRVRIVLTLRADFYDKPLVYPRLAELVRSHTEVILPLGSDELERAIAGPAERVGLTLEPGLVATIISDVGEQPGTLPLLQYALTELYEQRQDRRLTVEAYRTSGGIRGALARRADDLYDELEPDGQAAAQQVFLRLVTLGEGTEDTRRRILLMELASIGDLAGQNGAEPQATALDEVLNAFTQYRLLTFDRDPITRGPTLEIAHEALIREWGRLREWLNESRDDLRVMRRLMAATAEWTNGRRDPSFLASGVRLAQFETLTSQSDLVLNQDEHAYIEASIKERGRQEAAEQERQTRELALAKQAATSQRRSANRLRYLVGLLVVFLIVAAGLSAFAFNSRGEAVASFTRAEAQRVAVEANRLLLARGDTELIALLAIRSMKTQYSPQGDEALTGAAMLDYPRHLFTGHTDFAVHVTFSPDGKYILSSSKDKTARLWDAQTGRELRQFVGHTDALNRGAFSPDGKYILTGSNDKTARLWDSQTGQQLRQLAGHTGPVTDVAFSPDGKTVLTGSYDKTVRLWDIQTGQELRQFTGHTEFVESVVFSPDGKYVLSSSDDKTARLWDTQTGEELRQFIGHTSAIYSVAFSPDGRYALTGGQGGEVRLWDAQTGRELRHLDYRAPRVTAVAFSPDGKMFLTVGFNDNTVRLWDVQTGQELRRFLGFGLVWAASFSPDGKRIAITGGDRNIRLWDTQASAELPQFVGHTDAIQVAIYSPDGKYVLTSSNDYTARLWNAQTGQEVRRFVGHTNCVTGLAFSPDVKYALTGSCDKTARLWDVQTGKEVRQFVGHTDVVQGVAFSPDGKTALTGSVDQTARLWDVPTGQELHRLSGHKADIVRAVAFSPDGKTVVTGAFDGTVRIWDTQTGQQLRLFNVPDGDSAASATFSRDNKTILLGGVSGVLRLLDVQTGQEVRRFVGHTPVVWHISFSSDGRYILSGGNDNTGRLWDAQTGTELRRFTHLDHRWGGATFSPDGRYVLTGPGDMVAQLWDTDYHDTIRYLCSRLLRDFSDGERAKYGIKDKEPTCS